MSAARLVVLASLGWFSMAATLRADEPGVGATRQSTVAPAGDGATGRAEVSEDDARPIGRHKSGAGVGVSKPGETPGGSWLRTVLSLGGVTALILLLAWGYRLVTGGTVLAARPRAPGMIQVLSKSTLSPKQALYLVRVGPRLVLIGAAADSLTALHTIDDADVVARLAGDAAATRKEAASADFQRVLEGAAKEFDQVELNPPVLHPPILAVHATAAPGLRVRANTTGV